ncbi:MAG TPA: HupE/UreJ family protein [Casimicrobiaceae bacterium]|nr:HupE/UreJ family protein [Casimicrobiaceae bacterium]
MIASSRHAMLRSQRALLAIVALGFGPIAAAHVGQGDVTGGLLAGFLHPIRGVDHLVAMVAVGIWGAQLGRPAIWLLPITFPLVMAFGGVLGIAGLPLPGVEIGVAVSAIVLGAMIAFAVRPPIALAAIIVAIFAIFHGYAHGAELPKSANAVSYSFGFVAATGMLHAIGILIGTIRRFQRGDALLRIVGALIAIVGIWVLLPLVSGS